MGTGGGSGGGGGGVPSGGGAGSGGGVGAGGVGSGDGQFKPYGPGPDEPPAPGQPPTGGGYVPPYPGGASPASGGGGYTPGSSPPASPASPNPGQAGPPVAGIPLAGGAGGGAALSPGSLSNADLSNWSYWWYFNREGLLDLRRRFDERGPTTGEAFLSGFPKGIPTRPSDRALTSTVMPALFDATSDDEQATLRLSAGIALARIGEPDGAHVIEVLSEMLRERNPTLREGAALALGIDGAPELVPELVTVLTGGIPAKKLIGYKPNDRVRAFAAYGLGLLAENAPNDDVRRTIMRPLLEHLADTKERLDLRVAVLNSLSLVRIEYESTATILTAPPKPRGVRDKPVSPRYRRDLIERLWSLYAEEDDTTLRGHFPVVIGRLLAGAPSALRASGVARLLGLLEEKPKDLEMYGLITALGLVGTSWGEATDEALRATLYAQATKQRESHARHLAMMALSEVVSNSGVTLPPTEAQAEFETFLLEAFDKGRRADRPWIAMAAGSFGARLRAPHSQMGQATDRPAAHRSGCVGQAVVNRLREAVRAGGSPDELSAAILALGLIEDSAAAADIESALDTTRNKDVRGYAALSLGLLRHRDAMPKLEILLDDLRYDPAALEHAAMGLALLDRNLGSALLREKLRGKNSSSTTAPLAAAIGRVSDRSSVLSLSQLTADDDNNFKVRLFASIALGLICDRDNLTWRSLLAEDVNYAAWTPTLFDSAGQGVLNIF